MVLTRNPDPNDPIHYRMPSVIGTLVHRVSVVNTSTDWKFLDDANAHAAEKRY
jgi:hypothetical protein